MSSLFKKKFRISNPAKAFSAFVRKNMGLWGVLLIAGVFIFITSNEFSNCSGIYRRLGRCSINWWEIIGVTLTVIALTIFGKKFLDTKK